MLSADRRFRIEGGTPHARSRMEESGRARAMAPAATSASPPAAAIVDELRSLRALMEPMRGMTETLMENYRKELTKVMSVRSDVDEIQGAISGTKKELAAITVGVNGSGGVDMAAIELNTVIRQTEAATNDILAGAEEIEILCGAIQSETTLEGAKIFAGEIAEKITSIYTACNFQDLGGQRMMRVVDALQFVEHRIKRIVDAWGGLDELHQLITSELEQRAEERETEGDAALAIGPQPVNSEGHVDQAEIDALFD